MHNLILTHSLSAGGTIRQFFRKVWPNGPTRVVACYDDYSHGPLFASDSSNAFFLARQEFWRSLDLYGSDIAYDDDLTDEHGSLIKQVGSAKNVEIWIADSVQDAFYAVVTLHLLALDNIDTSDFSVRYFSGEQVKWGLGTVNVERLEQLYASTDAEKIDHKLFCDAWKVLSTGSGTAIKTFIGERDPSTPLAKALAAYLLRFPEFNGGLGSIERALLGAGTDEMKKSAYTVGHAMVLGKPESDRIGDLILFKPLVSLCSENNPWFKVEGDSRNMRSCSAQITSSGKTARKKYSVEILQAE